MILATTRSPVIALPVALAGMNRSPSMVVCWGVMNPYPRALARKVPVISLDIRRQLDEIARPDDDRTLRAQRVQRLAKGGPQLAADAQFLLEVNELAGRAILLQQMQNVTFQNLVHRSIISSGPARP